MNDNSLEIHRKQAAVLRQNNRAMADGLTRRFYDSDRWAEFSNLTRPAYSEVE